MRLTMTWQSSLSLREGSAKEKEGNDCESKRLETEKKNINMRQRKFPYRLARTAKSLVNMFQFPHIV